MHCFVFARTKQIVENFKSTINLVSLPPILLCRLVNHYTITHLGSAMYGYVGKIPVPNIITCDKSFAHTLTYSHTKVKRWHTRKKSTNTRERLSIANSRSAVLCFCFVFYMRAHGDVSCCFRFFRVSFEIFVWRRDFFIINCNFLYLLCHPPPTVTSQTHLQCPTS